MPFIKHSEYNELLEKIIDAHLLDGSPLLTAAADLLRRARGNRKPLRPTYEAIDRKGGVHQKTTLRWVFTHAVFWWGNWEVGPAVRWFTNEANARREARSLGAAAEVVSVRRIDEGDGR